MLMVDVHILPDDIKIKAEEGSLISEVLESVGIELSYPCGKLGTCGRCIVFVNGEPVKACDEKISGDSEIHIPSTIRLSGQNVLTDIRLYKGIQEGVLPLVEVMDITLEEPTLEDSVSDFSRIKNTISINTGIEPDKIHFEAGNLKELPFILRENNFSIKLNVIYENNGITVLSVNKGPVYGIAVDIGTTTAVTALCDLQTGVVFDTLGIPNPQAQYGSDVISRIVFTEENKDGLDKMQKVITDAIAESIEVLAKKAKINVKDIPVMVVAANTVMSHFFIHMPADYLRREPYVPAVTEFPVMRPFEIGMPIMPNGRVMILPAISSYVGGDITAGIIGTDLQHQEGLNLLVDVGTNGEMVLMGEGFAIACSSSAGPAFEGSGISCGSRALNGAIDNVYIEDGELNYDVIGGDKEKAASLCGSGLISLLSALLEKNHINRAGRFTSEEKSFELKEGVKITEPDILNLIRAKGAIFAGMRVLTSHMEMELGDLDKIYIAGGFGRNLNMDASVKIGMFPPVETDKYSYVGNSSLAGALKVLNDRSIKPEEVAASVINLELSVGNDFMEEFTKACFLPHTELDFNV